IPEAYENVTAQPRKAPPVATSQPVRASPRRSLEPIATATPLTSAKPSSQPACAPRLASSSRKMPVSPPNTPPAPTGPPAPPAGPPGSPGTPPRPAELGGHGPHE